MADTVSHTSKPQETLIPPSHANPNSKPYINHFLYKACLVTILLVLLPFFPSLAPEFINQTLHARIWELLQLIFVGIAVSYGLFSTKNCDVDDTDKDHHHTSKLDTAQSYVSKLLQVSSSVFEDESESTTSSVMDENKVRTWNNQYHREEPVVVVRKNTPSVVTKENGFGVSMSQKPLLLPVRSLKQRVLDEPNEELSSTREDVGSGNRSSSRRFSSSSSFGSRKARNGDVERVDFEKENGVLRSPIPWQSRSGRMMEIKKEIGDDDGYVLSPTLDDHQKLSSRSFRSSSSNPSISPKNLSPSSSIKLGALSSDSQAKSGEDLSRKRSLNLSSRLPPPPPPPPPPPFLRKWNSSVMNSSVNSSNSEKVLRRSVRSMPKEEVAEIEREEGFPTRMDMRQGRVQSSGSDLGFKPVRTFRSSSELEEKKATPKYETNKFVVGDKVVMGSSDEEWNGQSEDEDEDEEEEDYLDKSSQARIREDRSSDNSNNTDDSVVVNDDGDDGVGGGGGPDVDKKADEFIAKFREQIRLQRIESIRRSTAQRKTTSTLR